MLSASSYLFHLLPLAMRCCLMEHWINCIKSRETKSSDNQDKAQKATSTVLSALSTQCVLAVLLFSMMKVAFCIYHSCCFTSSCKLFGMQAVKHSSKTHKCGHFTCCLCSLQLSPSSYHVFTNEMLKMKSVTF